MSNLPSADELRSLLDHLRPATLLSLLNVDELPITLVPYQVDALIELDRDAEAAERLLAVVEALSGEARVLAELCQCKLLLRQGQIDMAILTAEAAAERSPSQQLRATALSWVARGLAAKRNWALAESTLLQAISLAPDDLGVLLGQARVALLTDQRLQARATYERLLSSYPEHAAWGLAHVAYLLGEFEAAQQQIDVALAISEQIGALFVQAQIALATRNVELLEASIAELERRSPLAESLEPWRTMLADLRRQLAPATAPRVQLTAFPTTVQRRDHCGPCTVELVLRYWKGGLDLTNDQIAQAVKFPGGGTPIYRMREFFHLVGFDTVRCRASIGQLKRLVDAGYPAIIEEEFPNSSHVTVLIGYDDADDTLIFQDPMTHAITRTPIAQVNQLRRPSLDSALVAFPAGQEHNRTLALIDLYNDQALLWLDQACLALDDDRLDDASELASRAIRRHPNDQLAWRVRLAAELELWERSRAPQTWPEGSIAALLAGDTCDTAAAAHARCLASLAEARTALPEAAFVHQYVGRVALLDGKYQEALEAYHHAVALAPQDARIHAALAEVYFAQREIGHALEAAQRAGAADPSSAAANCWMARCLAEQGSTHAQHFARCALESAPQWWLAHLAQAEVHIAQSRLDEAIHSLGTAQALAPHNADIQVLNGLLQLQLGTQTNAAAIFEECLAKPHLLTPISQYRARRALCRILFGNQLFELACTHADMLLQEFPNDPWALQFRAAAGAEVAIASDNPALKKRAIKALQQRYAVALEAFDGARWLVSDYLGYLQQLGGLKRALAEAAALRERFPEHSLGLFHGRLLAQDHQPGAAAKAVLAALHHPEGIDTESEIYEAIGLILDGMGVEAGAAVILNAPEQPIPQAMREQALGLLLADHPEAAELARMLLLRANEITPNDASIVLRLGMLAETTSEQEMLYRRTLMLAPDWSHARQTLAQFLYDNNRFMETLELTSGHAHDSIELNELHARALLRVGRYDESAAAYAQTLAALEEPPPWLFYYKWMAENAAGLHEAAAASAQTAIERYTDDPSWYVQLCVSLTAMGKIKEARQAIKQAQSAGIGALDMLEMSYTIAWNKNDLPETLAIIEQALELNPDNDDQALSIWERRRLRLLIELDRIDDVHQLLAAHALDANELGRAAWVAMEAERWPLTLELAELTLARDPQIFSGLFAHAAALDKLDRNDEAIAAYQALRQTHPAEHNAYEKLGFLLALDGDYDRALELAERAVALGPFSQSAWATRGYVYFLRGEDDKALDDLQAAWDRSNIGQRRSMHVFWWVLSELRGNSKAAKKQRDIAIAEANNNTDRRHIELTSAALSMRHRHRTRPNTQV